MEGPKISVSRMPLRWPSRAKARARFTGGGSVRLLFGYLGISGTTPAIVDFPTPPFAEETAIIFRTSRMFRLSGRPRCRRGNCGGLPDLGSP